MGSPHLKAGILTIPMLRFPLWLVSQAPVRQGQRAVQPDRQGGGWAFALSVQGCRSWAARTSRLFHEKPGFLK